MALNAVSVGDAIAAFIKASAPPSGTPITDAQLKTLWEGIIGIIYTDLKTNLSVTPGTFEAPPGGTYPGGAITGDSGPAL
jgi:hypothetical protein